MTFHVGLFLPAVLLLLFPADRLLTHVVELRRFDDFNTMDHGSRHRPWWWVGALWLDPLRSYLGATALMASLGLRFGQWDVVAVPEYSLGICIVALAVLAQLFTRRESGVFLAPVGFAIGILVAVAPWKLAAIGSIIALTGMFGMRQFYAFFVSGFAAIAFLGFVMSSGLTWLAPALVAFGLPAVAGLVGGRTLELPTRNASEPPAAQLPGAPGQS